MKRPALFISLTAACLLLASIAHADALPEASPSAKEAELLQNMKDAETSALEKARLAFPPEGAVPEFTPASKAPQARATPQNGVDTMLESLVREVEHLRAKEVVTRASMLATQKPRPAKRVGSKTIYSYKEGDEYEVFTAVDRVTDIQLQQGETLTNTPVAGDTVRWKIGILKSGSAGKETTHIILKPLDADLETNFIITTNRHIYQLRAVSGDWYIPTVSWNYPQEEDAELALALSKQQEVEPIQSPPEKLCFDYETRGDNYKWKPLRVFDDGEKIYLQMPKALRVTEAPALFVIEDGEPMLINYRVKGDYYIVDRLFERAELRVGPDRRVEIYGPNSRPSLIERIFE